MSAMGIHISLDEQLREAMDRTTEEGHTKPERFSEIQDILDRKATQTHDRFLKKLNRIKVA